MRTSGALLGLAVLLACAGCAQMNRGGALLLTLPVLPATATVPAADALFSVRVEQRGQHHDVLVVVARRGDEFTLRAVSEIGLTLFQWPQRDVPAIGRGGAAGDPEIVVRLLQLSLWPVADWERALAATPWRLTAPTLNTRVLLRGDLAVVTVTRSATDALTVRACPDGPLRDCAAGSLLAIEVVPLPPLTAAPP